jgi:hypothetical protein
MNADMRPARDDEDNTNVRLGADGRPVEQRHGNFATALRLDNAAGVLACARADQCMAAIAATNEYMIFYAFSSRSNGMCSAFDTFAYGVCGMFHSLRCIMRRVVNLIPQIFLRLCNGIKSKQ